MNSFDTSIIDWLNQFAHRWRWLDEGVVMLTNIELAKGGVLMVVLWWAWFRGGPQERRNRSIVVTALVASVVAILIGRFLAHALPFRDRPFNTAGYEFSLPFSADPDYFSGLSAFPSDHAVLFAALTLCIFVISRPVGIAVAAFVTAFVFVPRLYVGLHWPTDIIAGSVLGAGIAWVALLPRIRDLCSKPAFWILDRSPGLFYAGAFLATYQVAELFEDLRQAGGYIGRTLGIT